MKKTIIILSLILSFICSLGQNRISIIFGTSQVSPWASVDSIWRTPSKDSIQFTIGVPFRALRYHAILDSTGGGSITANNGLTKTANNVALGGTLLGNTTIDAASYELSLTGNDFPGNGVLNVAFTGGGSGTAFKATAVGTGTAISGTSVDAGGGVFYATGSGTGVVARSYGGIPLIAGAYLSPLNTVEEVIRVERITNAGTPTDGIGSSINFVTMTGAGGTDISNKVISKWTTAAFFTRTSEFSITGVNSATPATLLTISGAGIFTLVQGLTNYADNAAALSGGLTAGQLYRTTDIVKIVH